jgi:hypothetical protein
VSKTLLVAAGGGGDVIGAAMVADALGLSPEDTCIATIAWDRLLVDPVPGPRSVADFDGLVNRGETYEIVSTTRARHPSRTLLPRLRKDLGYPLFLLDPCAGVIGLERQLRQLRVTLSGTQSVKLIDVGGDVLANGTEQGLRSPLCDALTLAACAAMDPATKVLIAGPGLDAELSRPELRARFRDSKARVELTLTEVEKSVSHVLEWHPTEASAMLAAGAMGIRGVVEIRDAGTQVELTPESREVWITTAADALASSVAQVVTGTTTLADAESSLQQRLGWTELDHERAKAQRLAHETPRETIAHPGAVLTAVQRFEYEASIRGSDLTTFRRIAEAINEAGRVGDVRALLIATRPDRLAGPLWQLQ